MRGRSRLSAFAFIAAKPRNTKEHKMNKHYSGNPSQRWGHISYAQHGDDFMLLNLCELLKIEKPIYVDLGAHHPEHLSNTKLLYDRGACGMNVEANAALIPAFHEQRPRDFTLHTGVTAKPGPSMMTFHMYGDTSGINTFSSEQVEHLKHIPVRKTAEIAVMPISSVCAMFRGHFNREAPDILLSDIEGFDYDVLEACPFLPQHSFDGDGQSLSDFAKIIVVEVRPADIQKFDKLLHGKGYTYHCRLGENQFYIRDDLTNAAAGIH